MPRSAAFIFSIGEKFRLERRLIEEALRNSGGNKQKAAQVLGLSRQGLIKKLKRLSINQ